MGGGISRTNPAFILTKRPVPTWLGAWDHEKRYKAMSETSLHPIVILKGPRKKSQLRRLKKGRGKLSGQVETALDRVRSKVGDDNKILVPIVIHFTRKPESVSTASKSFLGN
ncbi:MAG TPA: hypothetical protein VMF06_04655 [Candidatus Limnocylindria bacterium]|nr:hypothetical protein [Candidatus Limnocylindria bacterium]